MQPIAKRLKEFLTEENWTKGTFARNEEDEAVLPYDSSACKFCVAGALSHMHNGGFFGVPAVYTNLMQRAVKVLSNGNMCSIGIYNDNAKSFNDIRLLLNLYEQYENQELELLADPELHS